jgi:hypothetical protein
MRVITQINGRAILRVRTEEVYPKEGVSLPDVILYIAEKYSFTTWTDPQRTTPDEIEQKGVQFRMGKFVAAGRPEAPITDFTINDWGIVASAHDTGAAEDFLRDVVNTLRQSHNFRTDPITAARMFFLSELLVQFEDDLDKGLRNFEVIAGSLQAELLSHYGLKEKYKLNGLGLDFQKMFLPQPISNLAQFLIERRTNTSFDENKYYCRAPFRTEVHIRILNEIEQLLAT